MTVHAGVAVGTTSTKAVAYDEGGRLLAEESEGYGLYSPHSGWAEQDPKEILDAVLGTLSGVVREAKNHGEMSCVSFSAAEKGT